MQMTLWRLNERLISACEPGQLDESLAELEGVAQALRRLETSPSLEQGPSLRALHSELVRAGALVESGLALQAGWARVLGAAVGGYTAAGDAAPLETPKQVSLQG
jgi:hypothetical protein